MNSQVADYARIQKVLSEGVHFDGFFPAFF